MKLPSLMRDTASRSFRLGSNARPAVATSPSAQEIKPSENRATFGFRTAPAVFDEAPYKLPHSKYCNQYRQRRYWQYYSRL